MQFLLLTICTAIIISVTWLCVIVGVAIVDQLDVITDRPVVLSKGGE
jgi:hypothetical protein